MQEREINNLKAIICGASAADISLCRDRPFVVTVVVGLIALFRAEIRHRFRLERAYQLSTDVTAEVTGYERLETDKGVSKYYIKAERARTFSDNHQELDNAYFEIYDAEGNFANKMTANEVLYVPEENKNFTAYMRGNVNIETREALKVKTNNIVYTKSTDTADANELVEFERDSVRGRSHGALVKIAEKKLDCERR